MNLLTRLALLFRGRARRDHELNEEIRSHMRMAVDDRVARGEPREEAERAVRREFGDPDRVKEVTRAMWPGAWLDWLRQDVGFGVRALRRNPAFGWSVVVVLIIGIGANVTVFTLADAALFRDAPGIADPDELVGIRWMQTNAERPDRESSWGYPDYAYLRAEADAFDGVLAYLAQPIAVTTSQETGFQSEAWVVSDNFFEVLQADMAIGRGFVPEEGRTPGTHPVVVISHSFWESRLGADPAVLGDTIPLNGTPFRIIGVTTSDFRGISAIEMPPDLYVPIMMQGTIIPGSAAWLERVRGQSSGWLRLVARLRAGMTFAGAQASLETLETGWHDAFGAWLASTGRSAFRMVVTPEYKLDSQNAARLNRMLGFVAMIAGAVLLIGCANVAILLLARGAQRRDEIAVRAALGARRKRLFAQLLVENLVVAFVGGLGGLVVAYFAVRAVVPLLPYELSSSLGLDTTVLLFAVGITLLVMLLFGVVPSARVSQVGAGLALRRTARVTGGSGLRNVLAVGQIAGATILVIGAGLFVRSIVVAQSVDLGFEPQNRLIVATALSDGYDDERGIAFMNETLDRARALPGVEQATVAGRLPFGGRTDERMLAPGTRWAEPVNANWVGPDYFETMGIPVVAGRGIDARDNDPSPRVLVLNQTTAELIWPNENAVGKTIVWQNENWTVVGIVADANYYALGEAPVTQVYVPMAQDFIPFLTFILKTGVPPETLSLPMESVIRDRDPGLTISGVRTLQDLVDAQSASYRLLAAVGTTFGVVALVLAVTGLYGVQTYLVRQRIREIGIRIALGARPWQVVAAVMRFGGTIAVVGVALGLPIAFALGRGIEGMLFGVAAWDPLTFIVVAILLLMTALLASYLPARHAGRVEPGVVLREE
jgi:predicted permease